MVSRGSNSCGEAVFADGMGSAGFAETELALAALFCSKMVKSKAVSIGAW